MLSFNGPFNASDGRLIFDPRALMARMHFPQKWTLQQWLIFEDFVSFLNCMSKQIFLKNLCSLRVQASSILTSDVVATCPWNDAWSKVNVLMFNWLKLHVFWSWAGYCCLQNEKHMQHSNGSDFSEIHGSLLLFESLDKTARTIKIGSWQKFVPRESELWRL